MDAGQIICIAVDDEPRALSIIESFAKKIHFVKLIGTFKNPLDAIGFLNQNNVDLVFLDINMPELSGIDFVKSLPGPPLIVFTTAYAEYAIESYEYEALDYLLKPIPFARFLSAVQKAVKRHCSSKRDDKENNDQLILKSRGTVHRITSSEILYVESQGNYLKVVLADRIITINSGLQNFLVSHKLPHLIRTHRSYATNMTKANQIKYNKIYIDKHELTIGRFYKENVKKYFKLKIK